MRTAVCTAAILSLSACGGDADHRDISSTSALAGDTAVVTIRGPNQLSRTWTGSAVQTEWIPPELRAVRRIALGAGIIAATDGRQVVALRREGGATFPVGLSGAGPGEYRRVASLAIDSVGQITLVDPGQGRVLQFDAAGQALTSKQRPLASPAHWNIVSIAPVPPGSTRDVVAFDRGVISTDGLEDSMRVVQLLDDGNVRTLFEVPDGLWAKFGGMNAKREAYGHRAIVTVDGEDGAAVSTGTDYLIRWWRPDAAPPMLRIEREWRRAAAGHDLEPAEELLDGIGQLGEMIAAIARGQERGEVKNAVDKLVLVGHGRLLVKVVDSTAQYHPFYLGRFPELRPPHWTWEVFDADGELLGQLRLPSAFTPHRLLECQLWGVMEEADASQSVARIDLAEACAWVLSARR